MFLTPLQDLLGILQRLCFIARSRACFLLLVSLRGEALLKLLTMPKYVQRRCIVRLLLSCCTRMWICSTVVAFQKAMSKA